MMNILCVHHRDGLFCVLVIFIFKKQLKLSAWGANIRMAIATVVVFWVPVEVLGRLVFFHEFLGRAREECHPDVEHSCCLPRLARLHHDGSPQEIYARRITITSLFLRYKSKKT